MTRPPMQKWKLIAASVAALAAVSLLAYQLYSRRPARPPTYDWQCAQCGHGFRQSIPDAASDRPVIVCPKCRAPAAERLMHYQCRNCWTKYDLRGSKATLANIICPACGNRAARDLDNPIPGDTEPVEGGKPYPGD